MTPQGGKLTVVGGTPEPIGGVTNFVYRLCRHFQDDIAVLYDLYPQDKKWALENTPHEIRPCGRLASMRWIWQRRKAITGSKVYFNFSRVRGLLPLALLHKRPGAIWIATLHHGDLESQNRILRFLQQITMRLIRSKIDRFGVIGAKQDEFYARAGVAKAARIPMTPYLPYVAPPEASRMDHSQLQRELQRLTREGPLIVASGYATPIYRHDWVVDYLNDCEPAVSVAVCLYGPDRAATAQRLTTLCRRPERFALFESLSPDGFQEVLKSAAVYVRPTEVDSFGIAVAEALALGKPVVASDACPRPAAAMIFSKSSKEEFFNSLAIALESRSGALAMPNENLTLIRQLLDGSPAGD